MKLHPDLATVTTLVGRWLGPGHDEYPNLTPF